MRKKKQKMITDKFTDLKLYRKKDLRKRKFNI